MKVFFIIFSLCTIGFIIFQSCKTQRKIETTINEVPFIFFDAQGCFGRCKEYQFKVFADANSEYVGIKKVEKIGTFTEKLSSDNFENLISLLDSLPFTALESEYLSGAKDISTFSLSYNGKTVKFHKISAPEKLIEVVNELTTLMNVSFQL